MLLEIEQGKRFMKLFCGLLEYTNEKYDIVRGLDFSYRMPEDMGSVAIVKEYLWKNDRIINDYVKENPHNLNLMECGQILKWKDHNTSTFFYVREEEGYSVFFDEHYFYYVVGNTKEIKAMLNPNRKSIIPVQTTLLPFEDVIVYDSTMASSDIYLGPNMTESINKAFAACKKSDSIIKTADVFLEKMKVPENERPVHEIMPLPNEEADTQLTAEEFRAQAAERKEKHAEAVEKIAKEWTASIIGKISMGKPKTNGIQDILESRTKKQLMGTIKKLDISGVASYRKAQIVEILKNELYSREPLENLFLVCSEEEIDFLDEIAEQKMMEINFAQIINIIVNFKTIDIVLFVYTHNKKYYVTLANEFIRIYNKIMTRDYRDYRETSVLISNHASAAVSIYGVISIDGFISDIKKYYGKDINKEQVSEALECRIMQNFGAYELIEDSIVHFEIIDDYEWYEYIKMRNEDIPRKEFPLAALKRCYKEDYYEETHELKLIREFILNNSEDISFDDFEIDALIHDLYDCFVSGGDINQIMSLLEDNYVILDMDKTNSLLQLIMNAKNNTLVWGNNGWTPAELALKMGRNRSRGQAGVASHQPYIAPEKIGRNEPCPCGSGKKYKHCCMLKNN